MHACVRKNALQFSSYTAKYVGTFSRILSARRYVGECVAGCDAEVCVQRHDCMHACMAPDNSESVGTTGSD